MRQTGPEILVDGIRLIRARLGLHPGSTRAEVEHAVMMAWQRREMRD